MSCALTSTNISDLDGLPVSIGDKIPFSLPEEKVKNIFSNAMLSLIIPII